MLCVRWWSDAGLAGRNSCWQVRQEPKTGQQKVQLYYQDDPVCPSRYIMTYLLHRAGALAVCWQVWPTGELETATPLTIQADAPAAPPTSVMTALISWDHRMMNYKERKANRQ